MLTIMMKDVIKISHARWSIKHICALNTRVTIMNKYYRRNLLKAVLIKVEEIKQTKTMHYVQLYANMLSTLERNRSR